MCKYAALHQHYIRPCANMHYISITSDHVQICITSVLHQTMCKYALHQHYIKHTQAPTPYMCTSTHKHTHTNIPLKVRQKKSTAEGTVFSYSGAGYPYHTELHPRERSHFLELPHNSRHPWPEQKPGTEKCHSSLLEHTGRLAGGW